MSKSYMWFFVIIVFVLGISTGFYFGAQKEIPMENQSVAIKNSIQDAVIHEVQAKENDIVETITNDTKISPYAKMTIEKHFLKCDHTTVDIIDVPKEFVNLTKKELQEKYPKWEIKKFEATDIYITRDIDANCSSHFVIKEEDGYLVVYNELTDSILELKETTDIEFDSLREEDKNLLEKGMKVYGTEELSSALEDFNS